MYLSLIFTLTFIIPFLVMPKHIKMGIIPPYRIVLLSVLGISVMAVIVFMVAAITGEGVYAQMHELFTLASEEMVKNPEMMEAFSIKDLGQEETAKMLVNMYNIGLIRIPATIMFTGAIVSYIAYIILSRLMSKKTEVKKMPKFREFSFPQGTAMAMMLMYFISWGMMGAEMQVGEMMYANVSMIFDLVFSLQGIAVVLMFFHFKRIPQAIGVVVSGFMWFTSIGKMFLVLIGMVDMIFGLRIRMGSKAAR